MKTDWTNKKERAAYAKAYYEKNKEANRKTKNTKQREYRLKNIDKCREATALWHDENPEYTPQKNKKIYYERREYYDDCNEKLAKNKGYDSYKEWRKVYMAEYYLKNPEKFT